MRQQVNVSNITPKEYSLESIYKHIEFCGRICYNSRDKITDTSYTRFYEMLCKRGHMSPLAHGTVYLTVPNDSAWCSKYNDFLPTGVWKFNPWIRINSDANFLFITTNMRFIKTYQLEEWLNYITEPSFMHSPRYTFEVFAPISCTRELNRHAHRLNGICEQSTRYCNLSGDIDYIFSDPSIENKIEIATGLYENAIMEGFQPQDAREILPLGTMSLVNYTAFEDDWHGIMELRSSDAGAHGQHPVCNEVANLIYGELAKIPARQ